MEKLTTYNSVIQLAKQPSFWIKLWIVLIQFPIPHQLVLQLFLKAPIDCPQNLHSENSLWLLCNHAKSPKVIKLANRLTWDGKVVVVAFLIFLTVHWLIQEMIKGSIRLSALSLAS